MDNSSYHCFMNNSFHIHLENLSKFNCYAKGETIFHLGQQAESIYKVITGEVHLYRHNQDGKRVLLYRAYDDHYFAEASLNSDQYHCTAVSVKSSEIQVINAAKMLGVLRENTDFAVAWITKLSSELRRQRTFVELLHLKSAEERLRHFILTEGSPWGELHLKGTVSDLSEMLGLSREALYRTIAKMEKRGVLQRADNFLKLK